MIKCPFEQNNNKGGKKIIIYIEKRKKKCVSRRTLGSEWLNIIDSTELTRHTILNTLENTLVYE